MCVINALTRIHVLALFIVIATAGPVAADDLQEYVDSEYNYSFRYPATWKLRKLPEGPANKEIRVVLHGPNASSFTVVVERVRKKLTKEQFEADSQREKYVQESMRQTMAQLYRTISSNMNAEQMKIGEQRDLSNEMGIKFYISTLHTLKSGKSIIVAGIHSYPFSKNYSVNFIMSTVWNSAATEENELLTTVFNSFQLVGEK